MSTTQETEAVIVRETRMADLSPEYAEIMVLGRVLQASGYFKDVRDQAQAVTKILCGRELGFSPIVSMQSIHIIEGKPALSSNLMATLIKRSGKYDYRVKVTTDTECVLTFKQRVDGKWEDVGESSFTLDDAKRAGVVRAGGSWSRFPKAMLFARAISQGLRTYCPDVSAAPIYNPEEMGAVVDEEGAVTELPKSARPVEVTTEDIIIETRADNKGPRPAAGPAPAVQPAAPPLPAVESTPALAAALEKTAERIAPSEYIGKGESANLHKLFREALKPEQRKLSDALLADWLKVQGIIDADGKGSALAIRKTNFFDVRESATQHAHSL